MTNTLNYINKPVWCALEDFGQNEEMTFRAF